MQMSCCHLVSRTARQIFVLNSLRNEQIIASTGNRTRAARVAGEHSTTEPSMLLLGSFSTDMASLQPR